MKIASALIFGIVVLFLLVLAGMRLFLLVRNTFAQKKTTLDDFFMAFIYALFPLKHQLNGALRLFRNTTKLMKLGYILLLVALAFGVMVYNV